MRSNCTSCRNLAPASAEPFGRSIPFESRRNLIPQPEFHQTNRNAEYHGQPNRGNISGEAVSKHMPGNHKMRGKNIGFSLQRFASVRIVEPWQRVVTIRILR